MTDQPSKVTFWFRLAVILLFIWNLLGLGSFYMHVFISEEALAALPENERALYGQYPLWTEIAFAFAVIGGALGSLALLLRLKWATPILKISLLAILIQMTHSLFFTDSIEVYGAMTFLMPVLVILIAVILVWLAGFAGKKGWLR